jgi:hypothetical protein
VAGEMALMVVAVTTAAAATGMALKRDALKLVLNFMFNIHYNYLKKYRYEGEEVLEPDLIHLVFLCQSFYYIFSKSDLCI